MSKDMDFIKSIFGKLFGKEKTVPADEEMKYVTQFSTDTKIYSEAPYTDDNYLTTENTTYILLENAAGKRDVEIVTTDNTTYKNRKKNKMYAKIIAPWLNGASLPGGGGGGPDGGEPVPVPEEGNGDPILEEDDENNENLHLKLVSGGKK